MKKTSLYIAIMGMILIPAGISFADYSVTSNSGLHDGSDGSVDAIGHPAASKVALPFTTSGTDKPDHISVCLQTTGSPTDAVDVLIETDAAGIIPSGTSVTSGTISASSLSSSPTYYTVTFSGAPALSASTQYWVVLTRTGSTDGTNFYRPCGETGVLTPQDLQYNGSTWAPGNGQFGYTLYLVTSGGGGGGGTGTTTAVVSGITPFLITSVLIYLAELFTFLVIMYIIAVLIGWPIKRLFASIKTIINAGGSDRYI